MPSAYANYTLCRGDEQLDLEIDFEHTPYTPAQTYGPPEDCFPAEGGEIISIEAYLDNKRILLSQSELENIELWLYENYDWGAA